MISAKGKFVAKYKTTLLSTGVPSFDTLLNGGLATKTITLIEEDNMNIHCSLLCQHFVSFGLSNGQDTAIVLDDETPDCYLENLPKIMPIKTVTSDVKLDIAWRYRQMTPNDYINNNNVNDNIQANSGIIDLSKCSSHYITKEKLSENLQDILIFCAKFIKEKGGIRKPLRMVISSLGSPMWGSYENKTDFINQIYRFLFCLKNLIGESSVAIIVTINPDIFEHINGISTSKIFRNLSNYVIKFEAFEDPKSVGAQMHNDITGQIRPIKIPCVNSIEPIVRPNTLIWSYHVRRKKMLFKEFSLPPCLSDNTSRTNQNESSKLMTKIGCGVDF